MKTKKKVVKTPSVKTTKNDGLKKYEVLLRVPLGVMVTKYLVEADNEEEASDLVGDKYYELEPMTKPTLVVHPALSDGSYEAPKDYNISFKKSDAYLKGATFEDDFTFSPRVVEAKEIKNSLK